MSAHGQVGHPSSMLGHPVLSCYRAGQVSTSTLVLPVTAGSLVPSVIHKGQHSSLVPAIPALAYLALGRSKVLAPSQAHKLNKLQPPVTQVASPSKSCQLSNLASASPRAHTHNKEDQASNLQLKLLPADSTNQHCSSSRHLESSPLAPERRQAKASSSVCMQSGQWTYPQPSWR